MNVLRTSSWECEDELSAAIGGVVSTGDTTIPRRKEDGRAYGTQRRIYITEVPCRASEVSTFSPIYELQRTLQAS